MPKPSETIPGRAWLTNFPLADRAWASRLLNSVTFVGATEFKAAMVDMINDHIQGLLEIGPIALHPVRNDQAFRANPFDVEGGLIGSGSALIALNIAQEIVDAHGPSVILAPDLDRLREGRVRSVLLVDDFIGSGRSVIKCIKLWRAHPTIRSWSSYHLIEFHLLTYSYCKSGYKVLADSGAINMNHFRSYSSASDFSRAKWTKEEESEIRRVCTQYSNDPRNAFGYGAAAALMVFDHTVPNNLPRILLQNKGRGHSDWLPFFAPGDRRLEPAQAVELSGYRPYAARPELSQGSPGLVASEQEILDRDMLTVLNAIERQMTLVNQIQQATSLTDHQIRTVIDRARGLGFVGRRVALTETGFEWLTERRHDLTTTTDDDDTYYYPMQLRGVVDGI